MSEVWGPWVQHDGGGCPLPAGTIVEVFCEDRFGFVRSHVGQVDGDSYSSWDWSHFPELKKILRYREKKPKGLTLLQEIARDVKVPTAPTDILEKA